MLPRNPAMVGHLRWLFTSSSSVFRPPVIPIPNIRLTFIQLSVTFSYVWRLLRKRPRVWPLFIFQYYYITRKLRTIRKDKQRLNWKQYLKLQNKYLKLKKHLISSKRNQETWVGNMLRCNSAISCTSWKVVYTLPSQFLSFIDFIKQQPPWSMKDIRVNPNPNAIKSILSQESCFNCTGNKMTKKWTS